MQNILFIKRIFFSFFCIYLCKLKYQGLQNITFFSLLSSFIHPYITSFVFFYHTSQPFFPPLCLVLSSFLSSTCPTYRPSRYYFRYIVCPPIDAKIDINDKNFGIQISSFAIKPYMVKK